MSGNRSIKDLNTDLARMMTVKHFEWGTYTPNKEKGWLKRSFAPRIYINLATYLAGLMAVKHLNTVVGNDRDVAARSRPDTYVGKYKYIGKYTYIVRTYLHMLYTQLDMEDCPCE